MVVWGFSRDQRAVIDIDAEAFGWCRKVTVGMITACLAVLFFQRVLDVQGLFMAKIQSMYTVPAAKQTCSISSLKTCTWSPMNPPLYDEQVHLPIEEGMVLNIAELGVPEPIIVWKDPETGSPAA